MLFQINPLLKKIQKQRSGIKSYDDYAALIKEWNVYGGSVDDNVRRDDKRIA